jgi:glycosyltransferase involved in cell wall biosynthesis
MRDGRRLSFVIPVYNEAESLPTLHGEIVDACREAGATIAEVLYVDDGSRDGTWKVIETIAEKNPEVRGIRFRRNFGKAAALSAGFRAATGSIVFTLDGDLQDDPVEVPRFLARLDEGDGLDVVSGWKKRRHDPWHKVGPSRVFNVMVSVITGCYLHDHNCGYKAYRREVTEEVRLYGELHRFVPVLAQARGFRVGEIEVHHRSRQFGRSKYGVSRFVKGLLDLVTVRFLTGYSTRPLHVFGVAGLGLIGLGGLGLLYMAALWLDPANRPIGGRPLLVYAALALGVGVQLISLGVLAELMTRYQIDIDKTYSVAEQIGPVAHDHQSESSPPDGGPSR